MLVRRKLDREYININFTSEKMAHAILNGKFVNCNFNFANLSRAISSGAQFENCKFIRADLSGVTFKGSTFRNCKFTMANLSRARFRNVLLHSCDFKNASTFDFRGLSSCSLGLNCRNMESFHEYIVEKDTAGTCFKARLKSMNKSHYGSTARSRNYNKALGCETGASTLIEPKKLPKTEHYRSPPVKVPKHLLEMAEESNDWDDYDDYWSSWARGSRHNRPTYSSKYLYGYKENAVLECPDIEEFRNTK